MDLKIAEKIGLLRHKIISPVLMENGLNQMKYFRMIENREFDVPGIGIRKFKASTMKGWLNDYRKFGFKALVPKTRSDKGASRKLSETQKVKIKNFRKVNLDLPATLFYDKCISEQILENKSICYSTFIRFLKSEQLFKKKTSTPRKRYEMDRFGELWTADFCHGPYLVDVKRKKKAILFAVLDDYSRVIVGAKFAFAETTVQIEDIFKEAILVYGIPDRLYVDNGPAFSSQYLAKACANLNIGLVHSKPYDSPSRGKIERFFRTVRERFLIDVKASTLNEINDLFNKWLRDDYHNRKHSTIKVRPIDRYQTSIEKYPLKRTSPELIDEFFMVSFYRNVRNDSTISYEGIIYEVPTSCIGKRVELRHVQNDKSKIYLYEDNLRVIEIKVVDTRANAKNYRPTPRDNVISFHNKEKE